MDILAQAQASVGNPLAFACFPPTSPFAIIYESLNDFGCIAAGLFGKLYAVFVRFDDHVVCTSPAALHYAHVPLSHSHTSS